MNKSADNYFIEGCGRCSLGGTPQCKVHSWQEELKLLRSIVLDCGLTEEAKWGVPTYTFQKKNVLIIAAFKAFCSINFFKGALLQDSEGILEKPGENTQSGRLIRFTNPQQIAKIEDILKAYIFEAIEVEKAGLKVNPKKLSDYDVPEEFQNLLDENSELKKAFEALTPGRQKAYLLHFSQPKQSKTRSSRIEKCIPKILAGKGMMDR